MNEVEHCVGAAPLRTVSGIADPGESLSPAQKRERTARSFSRKVELIEAWAEGGVPHGQWWPKTSTELRQWHQPDVLDDVRSWSSPNVASENGPYADLRRRFDAAVARLSATRPSKAGSDAAKEKAARTQAEAKVAALATQNAALLDRLRRMEDDLEMAKSARDAAQRRVRDYEEAFGKIRPNLLARGEPPEGGRRG